MLTDAEAQALDAILEAALVDSQADDGDPVFHEVDASGVNPFADKQAQDDVYASLSKKGLIECSGTLNPDAVGDEDEVTEEYVCITPAGLEALKAARGVN